jgi:hypothetical protein
LRASVGSTEASDGRLARFGRTYLRGQLKAGGMILIVVFSDDEEVVAAYFGAGSEPEGNRPWLTIERGNVADSKLDRD